jgi:acetylornithine deacetylase
MSRNEYYLSYTRLQIKFTPLRLRGKKKNKMKNIEILTQEAISLLEALIETPSFSTEEEKTAL